MFTGTVKLTNTNTLSSSVNKNITVKWYEDWIVKINAGSGGNSTVRRGHWTIPYAKYAKTISYYSDNRPNDGIALYVNGNRIDRRYWGTDSNHNLTDMSGTSKWEFPKFYITKNVNLSDGATCSIYTDDSGPSPTQDDSRTSWGNVWVKVTYKNWDEI